MGGIRTIDVRLQPEQAGWRLDRALAAAVPTMSRERLKALIRSGALESGERAVRDPSAKVRGVETFRLSVPEPTPAHNEPQDIPLDVVFEDEHLLVVDKPAGLVVHPAAGNRDGTLVNALAAPLRRQVCRASAASPGRASSTGSTRIRRGCWSSPRPTSPTKGWRSSSPRTASSRRYLAIVSGIPKASHGTVDAPLARSSANRKKIAIVGKEGRGKRAVTHWKRLDVLSDAALVECRLETGRTHQVRVHLASIGHPLIGDPVYGRIRKDARQTVEGTWISPAGAARGRARLHPPRNEAPPVVLQSHAG